MKKSIVVTMITCAAFVLSYIGKQALLNAGGTLYIAQGVSSAKAGSRQACRRIVSMAPSITETLFALGLGENVVAVTRYCEYPAEAKKRIKVGGYYDANYEAIVGLAPDLIVLLPEQESIRHVLEKAGFPTLTVDNKTIHDILGAFESIGQRCGVEKESKALTADIQKRMNGIGQKNAGIPRSKVLVSIGGNMRSGTLDNICAAGKKSFYGEMVDLAGGTNVYQGSLAFPDISKEGIVELNPQVIIDIVTGPSYEVLGNGEREALVKEWKEAARGTDAARNSRIYLFMKDYAVIPGPRFILALEDMARILHTAGEQGP